MTLAARNTDLIRRDRLWKDDDWLNDWNDWPIDWPKPRDFFHRFSRDSDNWWKDWPSEWPRMDALMPRFSTQLDRLDRNWRNDPFWMDIYPRWAEPIFKEGIDVNSHVVNDERKFAVDVDCYQFKPEEIQVKTLDDTLMIEGRHEDVRDPDNFTKMYFVRKYQLPRDVEIGTIQSSIDSKGRLSVEANKNGASALQGRERLIPIEGAGRNSPRYNDVYSRSDSRIGQNSPIHIQTDQSQFRSGSRSGNQSMTDSPQSRDVYTSQSYNYQKSGNRLSPNEVTGRNEQRAYSPYRETYGNANLTSNSSHRDYGHANLNGNGVYREGNTYSGFGRSNGIESEERSGSRAQSQRSESRNGYRVESPASSTGILRNGNSGSEPTSHSEYRSVKIQRKYY